MSLAFFTVALVLASASASEGALIGGAAAVSQLMNTLIPNSKSGIGAYSSTNSQQGEECFAGTSACTSGSYAIGVSDTPLDTDLEVSLSKFTIPLNLGTFSLVTTKAANLKFTACLAATVFRGKVVVPWSKVSPGLSGNIIPVARSDTAGATQLFGEYFYAACPSVWPSSAQSSAPWGFTLQKSGMDGVGSYVKANPNTLGYLQSGIGSTTYGLYLTYLSNKAGVFVKATTADPAQALPRSLPSARASWGSVSLVYTLGAGTYPVESLIYQFAKQKYATASTRTAVKTFLAYTQTAGAQNLMKTFFFWNLPTSLLTQNKAAIAAIA